MTYGRTNRLITLNVQYNHAGWQARQQNQTASTVLISPISVFLPLHSPSSIALHRTLIEFNRTEVNSMNMIKFNKFEFNQKRAALPICQLSFYPYVTANQKMTMKIIIRVEIRFFRKDAA